MPLQTLPGLVFPTPALPSALPGSFVSLESLLEGLSQRVHLLVWSEDALLWRKSYWRRFVLLDQPCSLGREGYGAVRKDGHPPSQMANEVTDVTVRSLSCTCSCFILPALATAAGSSPPPLFYQCLQLLHCLVTHLSNLCLPQLSPQSHHPAPKPHSCWMPLVPSCPSPPKPGPLSHPADLCQPFLSLVLCPGLPFRNVAF